ncbi:Carbamoyl-phosphate synthase large chain [Lactobacillus helveticus]|nr:Carbamoyl-phosphate synthase large chain [Lactobacillus helveticus]NRO68397.1 Carbamoyl-phosphate synthase large chain [Lactobacillus helveticus]NRO70383.1 Carbamoyl-phosphate synthase large chain [Lactobacillus helveticus]
MTKVHEDEQADDNILNELRDGKIDLVINTMGHDIEKNSDGFIIRQMAIQQNVPLLTALDTADALLKSLENRSFATDALK